MPAIKLVVLDIDGVIIGKRDGYNYPLPSRVVTDRLRQMGGAGIPIILCTTRRFGPKIQQMVRDFRTKAPQITHGGAVLVDPISHAILLQKTIDRAEAVQIVESALKVGFPLQLYTNDRAFCQQDQFPLSEGLRIHAKRFIQPELVSSLGEIARTEDLVRINVAMEGEQGKSAFMRFWSGLQSSLEIHWVSDPAVFPWTYGIITQKNSSKRHAFLAAAKMLHVDPKDTLGIGDWTTDWQFMEECGYVGAMGNSCDELKEKVKTKGKGHFTIGGDVDEDGVLGILDEFGV